MFRTAECEGGRGFSSPRRYAKGGVMRTVQGLAGRFMIDSIAKLGERLVVLLKPSMIFSDVGRAAA